MSDDKADSRPEAIFYRSRQGGDYRGHITQTHADGTVDINVMGLEMRHVKFGIGAGECFRA